jgi:hypothetical protein
MLEANTRADTLWLQTSDLHMICAAALGTASLLLIKLLDQQSTMRTEKLQTPATI